MSRIVLELFSRHQCGWVWVSRRRWRGGVLMFCNRSYRSGHRPPQIGWSLGSMGLDVMKLSSSIRSNCVHDRRWYARPTSSCLVRRRTFHHGKAWGECSCDWGKLWSSKSSRWHMSHRIVCLHWVHFRNCSIETSLFISNVSWFMTNWNSLLGWSNWFVANATCTVPIVMRRYERRCRRVFHECGHG